MVSTESSILAYGIVLVGKSEMGKSLTGTYLLRFVNHMHA